MIKFQQYLLEEHKTRDITEKEIIKYVKTKFNAIANIKNPSKSIQLAAVKQYAVAIEFIENPYDDVKILSLIGINKYQPQIIQKFFDIHINLNKNDIILYKKMINSNPEFIKLIYNPNINIQKLAISKDPSLLIRFPDKFDKSLKNKYKHLSIPSKLGIFDNE